MSSGKRSYRNRNKALLAASALAAMATWGRAADTGWNQTGAGPWDYNDPVNWVDGNITGNWDASLTLTASQTVTIAEDTVLSTGLTFNYVGNVNVTLRGQGGDRTLTLGGDITHTTASNRTIVLGSTTANQALHIDLGGATRQLTAASNHTISVVNVMSNGAIVASGGVFQFTSANTYSGGTTINAGNFSLNGANGSAANSDFVVNTNRGGNSFVTFGSNTNGVTGTTRVKSLTLNGLGGSPSGPQAAMLTVLGNAVANSHDVIANGLTVTGGFAIVSMTPNASANARLSAASFTREAGSTVLFRGTDLGVSTIASLTAGDANISFTTAPTLVGGAGTNTTDRGILVGAWGDQSSSSVGLSGGATNGLVTYDADYGIRLLRESEYKTSITDGQTQLDNVKLTNTGGAGIQTTTLTAPTTTINSLSLNISGTGSNGGITVAGDPGATLVINSGAIYATQIISGTTTTTNAMTLSTNIDLAGREGVIVVATSGLSSSRNGGTLDITGSITNDGGNGVTFGGTGVTKLSGQNTYTGTTYVNSGVLFLAGGTGNAIAGDVVLNGGTLEDAGNRIADTSNITINSGTFKLQLGNEGNSRSETFNNLVMNGGGYNTGSTNHSGATRILGYANLAGGTMNLAAQTKVTISGLATLSGTAVTVGVSHSPSTASTIFAVDGGLALVNPERGAYTPFTLNSSAVSLGGQLLINSDVSFTGNSTNANTLSITAQVNTNLGHVALNGVRTFNIGDGAATSDVTIAAPIVNSSTPGGINKTGAGTLELQYANSYSGGTEVSAGRLIVGADASLGSGHVTVTGGVLELDGNTAIDDTATLVITGGVVHLDFSELLTESVGQLILNGVVYNTPAVFDANSPGGFFTGTGSLTVVPEPGSMAAVMIVAGILLRRRRAKS